MKLCSPQFWSSLSVFTSEKVKLLFFKHTQFPSLHMLYSKCDRPINVATNPNTIRTAKFCPILTYDEDGICDLTFSTRFNVAKFWQFPHVLYPNFNKSEHISTVSASYFDAVLNKSEITSVYDKI